MVDGDWLSACVNPFVVRFDPCKQLCGCVDRAACYSLFAGKHEKHREIRR